MGSGGSTPETKKATLDMLRQGPANCYGYSILLRGLPLNIHIVEHQELSRNSKSFLLAAFVVLHLFLSQTRVVADIEVGKWAPLYRAWPPSIAVRCCRRCLTLFHQLRPAC